MLLMLKLPASAAYFGTMSRSPTCSVFLAALKSVERGTEAARPRSEPYPRGCWLKCHRKVFSGSTALNFPIHSTIEAGRVVASGRLCLLPLLGRLAFCSPPVGRDVSAVDYDNTKAPEHEKSR